jgi:hypothetical protein
VGGSRPKPMTRAPGVKGSFGELRVGGGNPRADHRHHSRRANPSSDTARVAIKKFSFNPRFLSGVIIVGGLIYFRMLILGPIQERITG